jgi:hypothetical protein
VRPLLKIKYVVLKSGEASKKNNIEELISITVHWIKMEVLTASFEEEMLENK